MKVLLNRLFLLRHGFTPGRFWIKKKYWISLHTNITRMRLFLKKNYKNHAAWLTGAQMNGGKLCVPARECRCMLKCIHKMEAINKPILIPQYSIPVSFNYCTEAG